MTRNLLLLVAGSGGLSIFVGAVLLASSTANSTFGVTNRIVQLSHERRHAEAWALGRRYFARLGRAANTPDECALLLTLATAEQRGGDLSASWGSLERFQHQCSWRRESSPYRGDAERLRRVLAGESPDSTPVVGRDSTPRRADAGPRQDPPLWMAQPMRIWPPGAGSARPVRLAPRPF